MNWTGATTTQWNRSLPSIKARADATAERRGNPDAAQQRHSPRSLDSAQKPLPEAPLGGIERSLWSPQADTAEEQLPPLGGIDHSPRNSDAAQEQLLPSQRSGGIENSPLAQNLNLDTTPQQQLEQQLPPLAALLPLGGIDY